MENGKICSKCGKFRTFDLFNKRSSSNDGLRSECKICRKKFRLDNKESIRKRKKDYHNKNRDKILEKHRKYYEINKDRLLLNRKKYYKDNESSILISDKLCGGCGRVKNIKEFHRNSNNKDGFQTQCKKCRHLYITGEGKAKKSAYDKKRISKMDKNTRAIDRRATYLKNIESTKITMKKYYSENKEAIAIVDKKNRESFAEYNITNEKLTVDEAPRLHANGVFLEVVCKYCGNYFIPTKGQVTNRVSALNGSACGLDNYLYCSDGCKYACPIFGKHEFPRGFKKATSREVNPLLRQMCFERDGWTCQTCGKTVKEVSLHCHHIEGYAQNPLLGNDIDNVVTLCEECHKGVHKLPGCNYYELRCN